jgi:uncharacterized protein YegP (UPF0339 family)
MAGKFIILKDKSDKFRFNLTATNGEIIISSESYPEKKAALKGIAPIHCSTLSQSPAGMCFAHEICLCVGVYPFSQLLDVVFS